MGTENSRPPITRITRGKGYKPDTVEFSDGTTLAIFGSRGKAGPIRTAIDQISKATYGKNTVLKVSEELRIGVRLIEIP